MAALAHFPNILGSGLQFLSDLVPGVPDDENVVNAISELTGLEELQQGEDIRINPDVERILPPIEDITETPDLPNVPKITKSQSLGRITYILISTILVLISTLLWAKIFFNAGTSTQTDVITGIVFTSVSILILYFLQPTV